MEKDHYPFLPKLAAKLKYLQVFLEDGEKHLLQQIVKLMEPIEVIQLVERHKMEDRTEVHRMTLEVDR